jgi:Holliday junction resolvase RusA-like endonuclease
MIEIVIPLNPITKKNHQQIFTNRATGKPFITTSPQYKQYLKDCGYFMKRPDKPIDYPVNIKAVYYMQTKRKVDITNLHEALHDILVHYEVIEDDNSAIVSGTDGSRVLYDKDNPRTEIEIQEVS